MELPAAAVCHLRESFFVDLEDMHSSLCSPNIATTTTAPTPPPPLVTSRQGSNETAGDDELPQEEGGGEDYADAAALGQQHKRGRGVS